MKRNLIRAPYDERVVSAVVAGYPVRGHLTITDRAEVVRRLAARGYSDGQTAIVIGKTRRTVTRIRARERIARGVPPGDSTRLPVDAPTRPHVMP